LTLDRAAVATAPRLPLRTAAFRNQPPRYDPRSGEGARILGGRFNPPNSFPVLYLCETRPCVVAELERQGSRHVVGVEGLLPRVLYRYDFALNRVLDLSDPDVRKHIGISIEVLTGDDLSLCRELGTQAHDSGDQAIRTPSATGVDNVLVVFPESLGASLLDIAPVEQWAAIEDVRAKR